MDNNIYNVALVGLGNIGMGYDLDLDETDFVLSHARAFYQNPNFNVILGVEKEPKLRATFERAFCVDTVEKIGDYEGINNIDLVVVATSTSSHSQVVQEILNKTSAKFILCEKPLSNNLSDAISITSACEAKNVSLYVNFIRRADPAAITVRRFIIDGKFKPPFYGKVNYSKGLFNTASHFTDLIEFWFGTPIAIDRLGNCKPLKLLNDVSLDFQVKFSEGYIDFHSSPCEKIANFDMKINFNNGSLHYTNDNHFFWKELSAYELDVDCNTSISNIVYFPNEMKMYQKQVVAELYKALIGRPHFLCHGNDALRWNREFDRMLFQKGRNV